MAEEQDDSGLAEFAGFAATLGGAAALAGIAGIAAISAAPGIFKFFGEIDKFTEKDVKQDLRDFTGFLALEFVKRVVPRTRVKTGLLRGNWRASKHLKTGAITRLDPTGARTIRAAAQAIKGSPRYAGTWHVFNNVRYAKYREDSDAMVALTKLELEVQYDNVDSVPVTLG